ncbi:hypothetical protein BV22DRAFT_1040326 [Leucogyrophana mollusca]|uniref:Uncharacterized protein n=1 Tax=Leucogyrophana mollusca TaxID=85980 RepID=A0ACB8B2R7_9AGAM|nr:hypothetical protein BV22DRAFT_1040326 [Leucogyrophana mollusca]
MSRRSWVQSLVWSSFLSRGHSPICNTFLIDCLLLFLCLLIAHSSLTDSLLIPSL